MSNKNFKVKNGLDIGNSISITDAGVITGLDTDNLPEGTNQYFTTARARDAFSAGTNITITDGVIAASGGTSYTDADARDAVANDVDLAIDGVDEVYVKTMRNETRVSGELLATRNSAFINPLPNSAEVSGNNGFEAVSSAPDADGPKGYGAGIAVTYYQGDTSAGSSTSPTLTLRNSAGTNATGGAAINANIVMGGINWNGHSGTDFASYVGTQNGGGGKQALQPMQMQGYAAQNFVESTISIPTTATTQQNATIAAVVSSGAGVFTNTSNDVRAYDVVRVTGTLSGTMTFPGYASGNIYYVIAGANPTTTFTLSTEHDGAPIATTAGTTTGLTFTRHRSIITFAAQTFAPFGVGSKVTVAGITPAGYNGNHRAVFGSTTSVAFGNYQTGGAQTVAGTVSIYNVTAGGAGFRIRGFPSSAPYVTTNRINFIDANAAAATYRSDSFTWQGGTNAFNYMQLNAAAATFNTGSWVLKDLVGTSTYATINSSGLTLGPQGSGNISYNRTFGCFHKVANVTAAAANTAYAFDWATSVTAHVNTQGVTVSNTSRLNIDTAGSYTCFVEMQVKNTENAARTTWVWLAKNGTDLADTRIKVQIKSGGGPDGDMYQLISKLWLLENIAANDYIEVKFAVSATTNLSLEYEAAQTTPFVMPAQPSATVTIMPVGA